MVTNVNQQTVKLIYTTKKCIVHDTSLNAVTRSWNCFYLFFVGKSSDVWWYTHESYWVQSWVMFYPLDIQKKGCLPLNHPFSSNPPTIILFGYHMLPCWISAPVPDISSMSPITFVVPCGLEVYSGENHRTKGDIVQTPCLISRNNPYFRCWNLIKSPIFS
jgi:hypothetical protein